MATLLRAAQAWYGVLVVVAVVWSVMAPAPALACGACVSIPPPKPAEIGPANPDPTVVQDAERVLFHRDPTTKLTRVWIEVRYTGLAKDFGWILPLPKVPKVGVGLQRMFDELDAVLGARYQLLNQGTENCGSPYQGCNWSYAEDSAGDFDVSASDAPGSGVSQPASVGKVDVIAQGTTGPYDYVVVKSDDVNALYAWVNAKGYFTPEKAKPIIASHVKKGDVFVAIKLTNGAGIQAIRPLALEMDDADPCVPLRLTSVAAVDDMTVAVTVAGPGRAVVKNHLDVAVNPLRLHLLGGSPGAVVVPSGLQGQGGKPDNYDQVLAVAIDEAGGHAFVTEASLNWAASGSILPTAGWDNSFQSQPAPKVKTLYDLAECLVGSCMPVAADVAEVVALPFALTATFPGVAPLQAMANLRACGSYWAPGGPWGGDVGIIPGDDACKIPGGPTLSKAALQGVAVDGAAAYQALVDQIVNPLKEVHKLLKASARTTRLVTRVSPAEMDRDPIFAFNPALEPVDPVRALQWHRVCPDGWSNGPLAVRISQNGLGSWVFPDNNATDPRFKKAPFALGVWLLDETGLGKGVSPKQVGVIDAAIAGAVPGKPSLPDGFTLQPVAPWVPPPSDVIVTNVGPWHQPPGCTPLPGWQDGKAPPSETTTDPPDQSAKVEVMDAGPEVAVVPDTQAAHDVPGAVPGIDAPGGWTDGGVPSLDLPAASDTGGKIDAAPAKTAAPKPDDGGCGAQPARRSSVIHVLALLALGLFAVLRRGRQATARSA